MSVPKGKRSTSKFEVYHHAVKMRTEITKWLLRDFGIKPKERTLPYVAKKAKMTEEDAKALGELFDRYGLGDKILEDFPSWWVTDRRIRVDEILARMMTEISLANSIYATSLVELQQRREHQNEAIGLCYALTAEVQFIAALLWRTTGTDIAKFLPFSTMIEEQIALLKAWRKSDNSALRRLSKEC